ncbi:DUF3786 domain-containing protein [Candidatus Bipolaricaulota bacterium]|nr:DUF3786 domain-containing protein [Candidatus Bipolaricaulota bacterium]
MIQKKEIRRNLRTSEPEEIAKRSGARFEEGEIRVKFFDEEFQVKTPEFEVKQSSDPEKRHLAELILNYLSLANFPSGSGEWIAFREIPHGDFYSSNFKKNTENRLSRKFQNGREKFVLVSEKLGGEKIDMGDSGYAFQALPRFKIALVFWSGGDEFRDKVNVLFEKPAPECLTPEGLSLLGKKFCNRFVEEAEGQKP